jgi:hypothetical protein
VPQAIIRWTNGLWAVSNRYSQALPAGTGKITGNFLKRAEIANFPPISTNRQK